MATKKTSYEAPTPASDKKKALQTALSQIEKNFGKGAVMRLGDRPEMSVDAIPTWVHLYSENGKKVHSVVPLRGNLDKQADKLGLNKTSDGLAQAKASKARTEALTNEGEKKCNEYLSSIETPIEVYNKVNN